MKFRMVKVESIDMAFSASTSVWNSETIKDFGLVNLETVGWLIEDREDCLVLAKEIQPEEEQLRHLTAIPKVCITKVTDLRRR